MVQKYAIAAATIGFIPGGSFILIPMEIYLLYQIAHRHRGFELVPFIAMSAALVTISGFLKGLATFLHPLPLIGQIANSVVAAGFVLIVGTAAEQYYAGRAASRM